MHNTKPTHIQPKTFPSELLQELSGDDLSLICGSKSKEDDRPIGEE